MQLSQDEKFQIYSKNASSAEKATILPYADEFTCIS